jgi:hypothetical protein
MPYAGPAGIRLAFGDIAADLRGLLQQLHIRWSVTSACAWPVALVDSPHDGIDLILDHIVDIIVFVSSSHELLLILLEVAMDRVCIEGCGVSDCESAIFYEQKGDGKLTVKTGRDGEISFEGQSSLFEQTPSRDRSGRNE